MSLVVDAMRAAQARTHARLAVQRVLESISPEDGVAVIAEIMIELEGYLTGGRSRQPLPPPDEPAAQPPPRRKADASAEDEPEAQPPESPSEARPSSRSGAGKERTRIEEGSAPSRALPGMTTRQAAEAVAAIVVKHPGIAASGIATTLGTTRDVLTRTVRRAMEWKLIRQTGTKSSTRYFPPES